MRLRARAFYFRDKEGSSLALVSCDLFAIPGGLQQRVAARLHETNLSVPDISRDNLIVTATHTHQGPGNYMSNAFYNGFGSAYPGFSRDLFNFLVEKIALAVDMAARDAENHTEGAELVMATGSVPTLLRNRAIRSFQKNVETVKDPILHDGPPPPLPVDCKADNLKYSDFCLRYRAVDPGFTVVIAKRPNGNIAALLVFGAVHPTVLSHDVSFYSPDLAGFAMRELELGQWKWERAPDMVAGFFNGAEGDVSPRWNRRDIEEVAELGGQLATEVYNAVKNSAPHGEGDSVLVRATRRTLPQWDFCKTWPTPGIGTLGGAEDGRFVSFDMGWRAPYRSKPVKPPGLFKRFLRWLRAPNQGDKQPGFELKTSPIIDITQAIAPPHFFPFEVPVTIAHLGGIAFLGVPAELTTAMGREVREKLVPVLNAKQTIILGLANEYLEYVTTRKEYEEQEYEGSSTLFGPATGRCYIEHLEATALEGQKDASRPKKKRRIPAVVFEAGGPPPLKAKFGVEYWGENREYLDQELKSPFATTARLEPDLWPRFEWKEEIYDDEGVVLWAKPTGAWTVEEDDDGPHPSVVTLLADGTKGNRSWYAYWLPKTGSDESIVHVFQVKIRDGHGKSVCSERFTLAEIRYGVRPQPLLPSSAPCPP